MFKLTSDIVRGSILIWYCDVLHNVNSTIYKIFKLSFAGDQWYPYSIICHLFLYIILYLFYNLYFLVYIIYFNK